MTTENKEPLFKAAHINALAEAFGRMHKVQTTIGTPHDISASALAFAAMSVVAPVLCKDNKNMNAETFRMLVLHYSRWD